MNMQQTKLGLALHEAGIPLTVDSFDDRLILQKTVYLLQQAQVHLGYRFRWYIRGPYSSGLTEDVFDLADRSDKGAAELDRWELDDVSKGRIARLRDWFSNQSRKHDLAKNLELLASVLFLIVTQQAVATDPHSISTILKANDKPFESADVVKAVAELKAHGYDV
jgi:uncharacterized protein YwgA